MCLPLCCSLFLCLPLLDDTMTSDESEVVFSKTQLLSGLSIPLLVPGLALAAAMNMPQIFMKKGSIPPSLVEIDIPYLTERNPVVKLAQGFFDLWPSLLHESSFVSFPSYSTKDYTTKVDVLLPDHSNAPAADTDCSSDHQKKLQHLQKLMWMVIDAANGDVLNSTMNEAVPQT
ncbi:zinc finger protein [Cricetulus griseus]|uniref:Zinc finger protein n=1 Tax=Cricetulus griseus TaxID=10029 RepID=A0A061IND8_CRIGR|nr:zinc finger protein [Cricetulus griseus]